MDLKEKVCVITGGTSGIGAATAILLAKSGTKIVTVSRKGNEKVDRRLQEVIRTGNAVVRFVKGDVADPDACRACIDEAITEFGRIDVLVHSAGGPVPGGLDVISDDEWMTAFAVHVHAVFHLARAAVPYIAKQNEGAIILLGSAAGLRGCLGALAYGVVKGAIPQFTRTLARELAEKRIRVNCVSPGIIRTPFQSFLTDAQAENNIQNRIPLRREGKADDVAKIIVALIENDFVTGENVVIDGGMTMRIV